MNGSYIPIDSGRIGVGVTVAAVTIVTTEVSVDTMIVVSGVISVSIIEGVEMMVVVPGGIVGRTIDVGEIVTPTHV